MQLSKEVKKTRHSPAVAAGTSLITPSGSIDMAGFEGCLFIAAFGAITTGAITSIKVQQSSDNGVADGFSDVEGTSVTVPDNGDNKLFYVDVYKPTKRYLKMLVVRGTQNAVLDGITAIQYGPRTLPTTHDPATVGGGELHVSPAEGTA